MVIKKNRWKNLPGATGDKIKLKLKTNLPSPTGDKKKIKILKQLAMSAQGFTGKVVPRIKMRNEYCSQKFEIIEIQSRLNRTS